MRKFKIALLFILPFYSIHFLSGQQLLHMSMEEIFHLADINSRSIRTFDLAEQEAGQAVHVAKNAQLPSVDISLSASYLGDAWLSDRHFSHGQNAPMPHFGNNFAIEASQVIYAGGAISAGIALAKLRHQLARLDKEQNKQEIRFLLVGNYLELYKLGNQATVYEKNIAQTRILLEEIRAKQAEGIALKNDITRYELQLKSLELALTQIRNSLLIINNQLITVLGLPEETIIQADSSLWQQLPLLSDEAQWQQTAATTSPALQQAELHIGQSLQGEKIAKAGRLPSIAIIAGDFLDGPITIEVPPIDKNLNYWYVGVGLKFDLASTFKAGKEIKRAKLSTQKAIEYDLLMKENIRTEVKDAFIRFREAFIIYDTQLKSLELAHQNYHVVNNRYLNELALLTDMLDASNSRLNAELQVVNAQINILFHYYKLKKVSGIL